MAKWFWRRRRRLLRIRLRILRHTLLRASLLLTNNVAVLKHEGPANRRAFVFVRPAGRTYLGVEVPYSPGKGKS